MVSFFSLSEAQAISIFATFMVLCYGTSLIGGYVADNGLGVKNIIMAGSALSALGSLCLISSYQKLCFVGLSLISLGSGYIKPNLPAAIGLLFENQEDPRKDKAFSLYYVAGNVGSLIAPILGGFIGKSYGWPAANLLFAAIFASAGYFIHKTLQFHLPSQEKIIPLSAKWAVKLIGGNLSLTGIFYLLFNYQESSSYLMGLITSVSMAYLGKIFYQCQAQERKDIFIICLYLLLFAILCSICEQAGTSLVLFFEKAVDRSVLGTMVPSSAILSLDSLFVLLYAPLFLALSEKYLEREKPMNGFVKMGWGFLCIAFCFGILAFSAWSHNGNGLIPLYWIIGAFFAQTMGELWIAPVSFSKISQYAPNRFKSALMSFWPMAIAYGHYFAGLMAQFSLGVATGGSNSLPASNPLEAYEDFFLRLSLLPLSVGLILLLCQGSKRLLQYKQRRGKTRLNFCDGHYPDPQ
jgi:POT family proton-dependent oligopeptide transporter